MQVQHDLFENDTDVEVETNLNHLISKPFGIGNRTIN